MENATEKLLETAAHIQEIQKSMEKFASAEKVEALAKSLSDFQTQKNNEVRRAAKSKMFKSQESYDAVANVIAKGLVDAGKLEGSKKNEWLTKAYANINRTDAGHGDGFVPTTIDGEISKLVEDYGILRREARIRPNVHGNLQVNHRATRVQVTGMARPDAPIPLSGSTYGKKTLSTYQVAAITTIEEKLIWDSPIDLVNEAISDLAEAAANFEDTLLFDGDGTPADAGFTGLNTANTGLGGNDLVVSAGTGLTVDDALNLRTKVHTSVFGKGKYYAHPHVLAALQTKKASTSGVYHFDIQKSAFVLGGSEIVLTPMANSGTSVGMAPLYYGDMSKAVLVGLGRDYQIRILNELYADEGQIGVRMVYDIGSALVNPEALAKIVYAA